MMRWLALGVALVLAAGAVFAWTRDRPGAAAAAATTAGPSEVELAALPPRDPDEVVPLIAPASDVTPLDREARRFRRYDKDRDGEVSQAEYLLNRRKAFDRLDVNRDGVLSFAESAAKTVGKFATADLDRDGALAAAEFAATAVKRKAASAPCPPAGTDADV